MSSEDEDMEYKYRPDEDEGKAASANGVPAMSKVKYDKAYDDFQRWNKLKGATPVTQTVLMTYFMELAEKNKPSTLWAYYSMVKATLRANDNIDITSWSKLLDFLKKNNRGYKPVKARLFTEEDIEKFLYEAPDEQWLDVKVVIIFGLNGTYSGHKLVNIKIEHIKQYEDMFWVIIPNAETKYSFTITGTFFSIVKKYADLRPKNTRDPRFFLHYLDGKCTEQPFGQNRFFQIPRRIAKYLKLTEPEKYSGPSFRIASAIEFIARHSVRTNSANMWMPNTNNACNSTSVAEQHQEQHSEQHRPQRREQYRESHNQQHMDGSVEYSLDYETGQLKTSTVSYTAPSIAVASSNCIIDNEIEHECNPSCGLVKCHKEGDEKSALHAFSSVKPSDYAITEVIPAQFDSDPTCRWMVAYSHFIEPVSFYNSDEKFEEIIRTVPSNVKVLQKYVRCNSSKLFAAYVVVYGVKCRCQKPIFGRVAAKPLDVFRKQNYDPLSTQTSDVFRKPNFDPLSAQPSDVLSFSVDDIKCEV